MKGRTTMKAKIFFALFTLLSPMAGQVLNETTQINAQDTGETTTPEGMTYDEAVAHADANPDQVAGFDQIFRDSITNNNAYGYSLTQSQYDWLPDDAAYWAFVHHSQVNPTGGDPGTALGALFEVYPDLETVDEPPTTMTYEEAVAHADMNPNHVERFDEIFRDWIGHQEGRFNLTQAQYDWLPDDAAYWTYVHFLQTMGYSGDTASVIEALFEVYPELETITEEPEGMTYDEAIAYADANPDMVDGFWQIFRDSMTNDGIYGYTLTQAQYDWLPEDAAYWAFVHHSQVNPMGGDPGTALAALFEVYPELESVTAEESTEPEEDQTINENPPADSMTINETEYIVDSYYILRPGEAGNQSEDQYMFVVEFEDEHTLQEWYDNVEVSQTQLLNQAEYVVEEEELEIVAPNEVTEEEESDTEETQFVYYELTDLTTPVLMSLEDQAIKVNPNEVFNLPPASAAYLNQGNVQGLIYDYGTVYGLTQGEVNAEVFEPVADESTISPEATKLIDEIKAQSGIEAWYVYEIDVNYEYDFETANVLATEDLEDDDTNEPAEIAVISTESDWQDMTFDGVDYFGLHDWTELGIEEN